MPGGAGEGCGVFSQGSITAVLNYHKQMLAARLIRNAIQSPWQANPLTGNSRDKKPLHSWFLWSGQWRLLSLSWGKVSPSTDCTWQISMETRAMVSTWEILLPIRYLVMTGDILVVTTWRRRGLPQASSGLSLGVLLNICKAQDSPLPKQRII